MIPFNPLNEDTGKKYKMNAVTALCRYYKAMGWYKFTDEIDQWIADACDKKKRELKRLLPTHAFTPNLKSFLMQHYSAIGFGIQITEKIDIETGEILNYLLYIYW